MEGQTNSNRLVIKVERDGTESQDRKIDFNNHGSAPIKKEKKRKRDMFTKLYHESLRRKAMEDLQQQQPQELHEETTIPSSGCAVDGQSSSIAAVDSSSSIILNHNPDDNSRRKVYLIPRIIKTDIRRQYATMFANVYNSQNVALMQEFLETYFRKDFIYSQTGRHYQDLEHAKICTIHDFKAVSEFWYEHMLDTPDLVFKLGKVQFKLKSDNTGTVTFQCSITGTRCSLEDRYKQEMALFAKYNVEEKVVDTNRSDFVIDPFDTPISEPDRSLIPYVHQYPHTMEDSDIELSPYAFQGLLTLHLDACSKIFSSTFQLINFAPLPWDSSFHLKKYVLC